MIKQKLEYCHHNPILAGLVRNPEDWKYNSAIDYNGGKGLMDLILIDPMIMQKWHRYASPKGIDAYLHQ